MKSIRSTQYVTAFGPGAIFDFGGESLIAMDQDAWNPKRATEILLPRLQQQASSICGRPINHFLVPPIEDDRNDRAGVSDAGVPYYRFPRWLFCPDCRHMARWEQRDEEDLIRRDANAHPTCNHCESRSALVPMRFVYVCKAGHIGDINWPDWVHSHPEGNHHQPGCKSAKDLSLNAITGAGGGLASLVITCNSCKARRSLGELMKPTEISRSGTFCRGAQPWIRQGGQCNEMPRAEQRGSSNVYFPRLLSALDIPDLENTPPQARSVDWHQLNEWKRRYQESPALLKESRLRVQWRPGITSAGELVGLTFEQACEYIEHVSVTSAEVPPTSTGGALGASLSEADELLKQDEWTAFLADRTFDQFKCLRHEIEAGLLTGISFVTEVKTLREVRAFTGFSRLSPSNTVVPSSNHSQWLPGIEVFGEGIFLALDESALLAWEYENRKSLKARLDRMLRSRNEDEGLVGTLPEPTPRFVLLHTLSHALIRQLSFECGYETASLRERLYCSPGVNGQPGRTGVLIYTASSDSEGALGGLARQGVPDRFVPGFRMAIKRSSWCSSDPVCAESQSQGLGGLNRAACHACMLITETSCTCFNTMLDRSLLIGDGSAMHGEVKGFFRNIETDIA